jgi:hypothetical protein
MRTKKIWRFRLSCLLGVDETRDHVQLLREARVVGGVEEPWNGLAPVMTLEMSELALSSIAGRGQAAERGLEEVGVLHRERVVQGGGAQAVDRGARAGTGERDGAEWCRRRIGRCCADLKGVLSVQGDRHRDAVVRIERIREIGEATAPAAVTKGLSAMLLCHSTCWSLCEKSCGGRGTEPFKYCAFVIG